MNLPNSNILEIIISITLIYAMLSILVSIIVEARNFKTQARAKLLRKSIRQLLHDPHNYEYGELFYNHFMISGLKSTSNRPPQYISASMFADVLIDTITHQVMHSRDVELVKDANGNPVIGENGKTYVLTGDKTDIPEDLMKKFHLALANMNPSPFRDLLFSFCQKAEGKVEKLKPIMEEWYNDYMDRVSGWYKTDQRKKLRLYGFVVAILLNVDSIHLVRMISLDSTLRGNLVNTAENVADNYNPQAAESQVNSLLIDDLYKAVPDSLKNRPDLKEPENLLRFAKGKMPAFVKERTLYLQDSVERAFSQQADSVMSLIAALNVPIGWSSESAPYTWLWPVKETCGCKDLAMEKGLMVYIEKHNHCPSFAGWLWYLLGIVITGFSLSFGAPFWFEMLVKVVNIRRAGVRPKTKTDSKS